MNQTGSNKTDYLRSGEKKQQIIDIVLGSLYLSSLFSLKMVFDSCMLPKKVWEDWMNSVSHASLSVISSIKYVKKSVFEYSVISRWSKW